MKYFCTFVFRENYFWRNILTHLTAEDWKTKIQSETPCRELYVRNSRQKVGQRHFTSLLGASSAFMFHYKATTYLLSQVYALLEVFQNFRRWQEIMRMESVSIDSAFETTHVSHFDTSFLLEF